MSHALRALIVRTLCVLN